MRDHHYSFLPHVQLADEILSRKSLGQSLKDQTGLTEKHKEEVRELGQKLQGYRVSLKVRACVCVYMCAFVGYLSSEDFFTVSRHLELLLSEVLYCSCVFNV